MTRTLPGFWGRSGGSRIDTRHICTSDCLDLACPARGFLSTHPPRDAEYECDIGPDDKRVIAPPPTLPNDVRSRAVRRALVLVAAGFALLGALIGISDPRWVP